MTTGIDISILQKTTMITTIIRASMTIVERCLLIIGDFRAVLGLPFAVAEIVLNLRMSRRRLWRGLD
jgi:hypothetical protein